MKIFQVIIEFINSEERLTLYIESDSCNDVHSYIEKTYVKEHDCWISEIQIVTLRKS